MTILEKNAKQLGLTSLEGYPSFLDVPTELRIGESTSRYTTETMPNYGPTEHALHLLESVILPTAKRFRSTVKGWENVQVQLPKIIRKNDDSKILATHLQVLQPSLDGIIVQEVAGFEEYLAEFANHIEEFAGSGTMTVGPGNFIVGRHKGVMFWPGRIFCSVKSLKSLANGFQLADLSHLGIDELVPPITN